MNSLVEAMEFVEDNRDEGVHCPCCGKLAKNYTRKLNSGMAHQLILFYRSHGLNWFNLEESRGKSGRDVTLLQHWGLIRKRRKTEQYDISGYYRVTEKGERFIQQRSTVARHVVLYNNEVVRRSSRRLGILSALGAHFDYEELMKGKA